MYIYSSRPGSDGFMNEIQVCLAGVRSDGTVVPPSDVLTAGNIHSVAARRLPNTANGHAVNGNGNGFWRYVILRYPPQGDSTPETRQEGLACLNTFFKDPMHSRFPPAHITLIDEF